VKITFSRVIQPTDCDRSICTHGHASGRSERRSISGNHNRGNAGSHSQIEKKYKAPGADNITAEEIQAAGNAGVELQLKLCQRCCREERFPQLWTKSVVVPIHMKRDKLSCDNYRGVSLLSHCGKVMTSIILQRIRLLPMTSV